MERWGLIFAIWRLTTAEKFSPASRPICSIGLATGLNTAKREEAEEDGHKNYRLYLPNEGCVHPDQIQRAHPEYLSEEKKGARVLTQLLPW